MLRTRNTTREASEMSNVDTARSAHEAFSRGDLATLKESYAQDAVWVSSDEIPPGGEIHGRDAIIEMMGRLPDYWSTVSVEPDTYIDGGDYVVVLGTVRFGNDNGTAESPFVNVLKFDGEGKTVRGEIHYDTAKFVKLQA
ncbi:hypothetical protein AWB95_03540 [Mycobacterium celatum]|uniref:Nuclear transport factor 2 family protein n=2 Tax=Mycobacterium celatum TaxID=28045 RepID=A0A1X1RW07_MYCCE|nr:hypothetical protein AWB95_03540 [Mycobacterium celatum]PIB80851.1 nuclear transport factor 2 family protein [Mycobacterium celatum]